MKKVYQTRRGFLLVEVALVVGIIATLIVIVIETTKTVRSNAQEKAYISYVGQAKGLVDKAVTVGVVDDVSWGGGTYACAGTYASGQCWGKKKNYTSTDFNEALSELGDLPTGETSPYHIDHGVMVWAADDRDDLWVYAYVKDGDATVTPRVCNALKWSTDPDYDYCYTVVIRR